MPPEIEVISEVTDIETIVVGRSIRELDRLQRSMAGVAGVN